ncbi:hypothetical protein ACOJCM_02285 [Billgrantia sp. LNSP4103-1]|uniref:hypothetical protein n=1 Tax=Billgrantia sp. LNSP4103-1 TaxID=3410266 RepID=UPI00403F55BF
MKKTKRIIRSVLGKAGVEVRRVVGNRLYDLAETEGHPIEAVYASRGKPCLVRVPLTRIVTFGYSAFSLGSGGGHPFLKALEEYENGNLVPGIGCSLRRFYELYRPSSASELMGLDDPSYTRFNELPALSAPPLWEWQSPDEYCTYIKSIHEKEDVEQGARFGAFAGGSQFGPVEERKLFVEYRRLVRLYESIKSRGFSKADGDPIAGVALVNENDWLIALSTGQHRIACLAALGYESVIVKLLVTKAPAGLMLRSCYRHFPTVVNGYHAGEEALDIFDRIMARRPPKAAQPWLEYCRQHEAAIPENRTELMKV